MRDYQYLSQTLRFRTEMSVSKKAPRETGDFVFAYVEYYNALRRMAEAVVGEIIIASKECRSSSVVERSNYLFVVKPARAKSTPI